MPSKELIIHTLLSHDWVAGTVLAEQCGISRTAVWNNIAVLKDKGYGIESHPKHGYKLVSCPDLLYPELIRFRLNTSVIGNQIVHHTSTGSTNDDARELALKDAPDGTVIVAHTQTNGRGRCNRTWESTPGKSIAVSIILRPQRKKPREAYQFTMMTAVAVIEAVDRIPGISASIKWPNDILIHDTKVAGILTELNGEMDMIRHLIIGVGINVNQDSADFPDSLPHAGSLKQAAGRSIDRLSLLQTFLARLDHRYTHLLNGGFDDIFAIWKQRCYSIGKRVSFDSGSIAGYGTVADITSDGGLQIKRDEGSTLTLFSGDIRFV